MIPHIEIFIVARSFYDDDDTVRYRQGITRSSLVDSLMFQTDKHFTFCWLFPEGCPHTADKVEILKKSGVRHSLFNPPVNIMRLVVEVDDDLFLCPTFVERLRNNIIPSDENWGFICPNGYSLIDGVISVHRHQVDVCSGSFIGNLSGDENEQKYEPFSFEFPAWCWVKHKMNTKVVNARKSPASVNLSWDMSVRTITRYVQAKIATATSCGSNLEPNRSKSMIKVKPKPGKVRRKSTHVDE